MAIIFLTPPLRRPYELYYFCNLSEDVIIVVDAETFMKYSDYFDEFKEFNYQYFFVSKETERLSKFFNFSSTAALVNYNEEQISRIIQENNITKIATVEMFSSLSMQASRLSSKFSLSHIVIVWENIRKSIFSLLPPFSINTKIVKSTADKFIAASNISKQAMISLHINEVKIQTVYPGIFTHKFEQSLDSSDKILFVGNLEPHKGVNVLLKAFEKLSYYLRDVKLVIVGTGSLEPEITKLKKDSRLKIEYKGYIPHSRLPAIYSDASIYCSPNLKVRRAYIILTVQEQFGFTLVEAMASGLPIVSSNIGTIPEIVGSENLIVSPTINNTFDALYQLLTCDEMRKGLRDKNRKRSICKFNALTQSSLFEKAINS